MLLRPQNFVECTLQCSVVQRVVNQPSEWIVDSNRIESSSSILLVIQRTEEREEAHKRQSLYILYKPYMHRMPSDPAINMLFCCSVKLSTHGLNTRTDTQVVFVLSNITNQHQHQRENQTGGTLLALYYIDES